MTEVAAGRPAPSRLCQEASSVDISVCIPCMNRSRMEWQGKLLYPLPVTVAVTARALSELGLKAEIIVADYGSTDWPPEEWIRAFADPIPAKVIPGVVGYTTGGGKNLAAWNAAAPILFFSEAEMLPTAYLIERGLEVTRDGRGYFPLYRRHPAPGSTEYVWGNGHGCCIVRREHWEQNHWYEAQGWGADEDTKFGNWFLERGLIVRERIPMFIHQWHPLSASKLASENKDAP